MIWPEFGQQWKEDKLQMYVVMQSNKLGLVFHADGNGNYVNGKTAGRKKLMGARAGWPDLCYWTPRLLYIELKTMVGVQSKAQKEIERLAKMANIEYHLVRALDGPDCWNKVRGVYYAHKRTIGI